MKDEEKKTYNGWYGFLAQNRMQLFLLSLSAGIAIVNLFIASLISPIKSDIQRVEAITLSNQKVLDKKEVLIDRIEVVISQLDSMERRLDRIENVLYR